MALANWAAYLDAMVNPSMRLAYTATQNRSLMNSSWVFNGSEQGAVPTVPVAPSSATQGAMVPFVSGTNLRIVRSRLKAEFLNAATQLVTTSGMALVFDRLSHMGGLSGTVTGAQTTNLPTAPLTRYTTGTGVWALLEIYTTLGATVANATISYTNDQGVSGRMGPATHVGQITNDHYTNGIVLPFPLQAGDKGVRSVESVTLDASTGTVGNFGITLAKPIAIIPTTPTDNRTLSPGTLLDGLLSLSSPLLGSACLWLLVTGGGGQSTSMNLSLGLDIAEV